MGIGCPEATLPPSEVMISLVISKILLAGCYAGHLHFLDRVSHVKADKEGKGAALWCNISRQLSPGFSINRMTCIAEQCGHRQRNGPLTFLPDSHIRGGLLVSPSLLCFPDTESGMKIHLPLSWPRVGAGVLLGFPGWEITSPGPSYISRPVWRGSAGLTRGTHSTGENTQTNQPQANMMVMKVEELVRRTPCCFTVKTGLVLIFI